MPENKHNDPLERFFRKKAGEYNIQYKEEDWLKLENRLDKYDEQYAARRQRYLAAAVVIFLFSVLAYVSYEQQLKINELNKRLTDSERVTNPNPVLGILQNEPTSSGEKGGNQSESTSSPPVVSNEQTLEQQKPAAKKTGKTKASEKMLEEDSLSEIIAETNLAVTSAKDSPGFDGRSPAISAIKPSKISARITTPESPRRRTSSLAASKNTVAMQKSPRFSIGLLAGPDLSTVGGVSNFYDPGHKLGLSVEYHISKNLAVSVGAIHSKVRYTARGNEYHPPQNYWSYNTTPDQTVGECILIDIPISLKYDFWHFENSRIYTTAGLSSYIMLDEDYRFNYENNYPGLRQRWHEKTGTRHWMSNATVSLGYELDIMHKWSLRAEPFLKIPLQEVGWGNVKLYSLGSFVSLNYHIH